MKKYLTVSEYAALHNIKKQAVYKKLKRLDTIRETRNGREITLIVVDDGQAPEEARGIQPQEVEIQPDRQPYSTEFQPEEVDLQPPIQPEEVDSQSTKSGDSQPLFNPQAQGQDSAALLLSTLQKQIEEKDRQIERLQRAAEEKDKQIQEQFERLTSLLLRSQQLEALTHKLLGQGEDTEEETAEGEEHNTAEEPEEQPQKRSFWRRLFGI